MQVEIMLSLIGTVCTIICTVLSIALLYFRTISSIDKRLTKMETKISLFWRIVEKEIPRLLKAPTHEEMDGLLDLMSVGELTKKDAIRLKEILEEEVRGSCQDKVLACVLLLARVEQIIVEGVAR